MSRGKFITLEGIDGAGKSTHVGGIADTARLVHMPRSRTRANHTVKLYV